LKDEFLWVEKYRPETIEECILPENLKSVFKNIVNGEELPNMLFSGTAGLGKTTVAKALCNELGLSSVLINASKDGNIDTLRGRILKYASTLSMTGKTKVIILDEADYLNPQSTQPALRGFIEEFSDNCRFILTCNYKNRIIEPLHSRCAVYEFNSDKKILVSLCEQMMQRSCDILSNEGFDVSESQRKSIANLIMRHAPDWRRVLNELQKSSLGGNTSFESRSIVSSYDMLFDCLSKKDFKKTRRWVVDNLDIDATEIFRGIYDRMYEKVAPNSIPQFVLILADYQYKAAFVADHELNLVACLTEIMSSVEFV